MAGAPTAPTQTPGNNTTKVATTAFVTAAVAAGGSYSDEQAQDAVGGILDNGTVGDINFTYDDATPKVSGVIKSSVALAGSPTTTTQSAGDSSTKVATTAFVGTAVASAGALVLLEQHAASSSATLDFTTWYAAAYDDYLIEILNLIPATNAVELQWRASTDGGSSYDSSALYSYVGFVTVPAGSGQAGVNPGAPATSWVVSVGNFVKNDANWGVCGTFRLVSPGSAIYKRLHGNASWLRSSDSAILDLRANAAYQSATAVNAFRFFFSSGNITSGIIRVYGVAK